MCLIRAGGSIPDTRARFFTSNMWNRNRMFSTPCIDNGKVCTHNSYLRLINGFGCGIDVDHVCVCTIIYSQGCINVLRIVGRCRLKLCKSKLVESRCQNEPRRAIHIFLDSSNYLAEITVITKSWTSVTIWKPRGGDVWRWFDWISGFVNNPYIPITLLHFLLHSCY